MNKGKKDEFHRRHGLSCGNERCALTAEEFEGFSSTQVLNMNVGFSVAARRGKEGSAEQAPNSSAKQLANWAFESMQKTIKTMLM